MRWKLQRGLLVLLVGCLCVAPSAFGSEPSDLVREVDALGARMNAALVDGDYEAVLACYADDAVMLPNGGEKLVGKKAIRDAMFASRDSGLRFQSFSGRVEKAWECGGMVIAVGAYALSASVPDVKRPIGDKGKFVAVYRRESTGSLKLLYDIWNTDIEPGK